MTSPLHPSGLKLVSGTRLVAVALLPLPLALQGCGYCAGCWVLGWGPARIPHFGYQGPRYQVSGGGRGWGRPGCRLAGVGAAPLLPPPPPGRQRPRARVHWRAPPSPTGTFRPHQQGPCGTARGGRRGGTEAETKPSGPARGGVVLCWGPRRGSGSQQERAGQWLLRPGVCPPPCPPLCPLSSSSLFPGRRFRFCGLGPAPPRPALRHRAFQGLTTLPEGGPTPGEVTLGRKREVRP